MLEALFSAVTEAVFGFLIQEFGLADRVRAVLSVDPGRRAFQIALARAYSAFARHYPHLTASLFDESFLRTEAAPLLAQLLTRRGRPDPAELARRWAAHLGYPNPETWPRLAEATRAAADFLKWLEEELAQQPALQPLWDSRALERIAENLEDIRRKLADWPRVIAEAQGYVQVTGNVDRSILVTGDRNIVTQVFQAFFIGDYASLSDLYLPPDPVFHRVRLEEFVGRAWLEAELDHFLSQHECGAWLLVGEAGVGKTAFLAHLVKERGYLHFFAEQAPGEAGVIRALQSIAAQLVARYRLEPYASRDALPAQAAYPDFLERLLHMAANRLTARERLVIVVDALDEAGVGPNGNALGLPKSLPKGVYLILSQRPVSVPLRVDPHLVRADLQAGDRHNLEDIEAYLRVVARDPAISEQLRARNYAYAEEDFIRILREKSAGNWMYLRYVVAEILRGKRHPLDLEQLPMGLTGYYAEYWRRWRQEPEWDRVYAPLLSVLAAAREPVPLETLARWAGLKADYSLKRLLTESWSPFLYQTKGLRYRLYHASLRDFLSGKVALENLTPGDRWLVEEMSERTREAHRQIASSYIQSAGGDWRRLSEIDDGYGLRHLGAHLAAAGEWEKLHKLVAEGDEHQPWAEARYAAEGDYGGYLMDLELARRHAMREGKQDPRAVGRQARYALIEASIRSLAGNIPPELLIALVEKGLWKASAALGYARQVPDERHRAHALTALAPHLFEGLLREALEVAREIRDEWARAWVLAELAPRLPEDQRVQALREALEAAREIQDEEERARVLAKLAPRLPEDQRVQALREALEAAREIRDEPARAEALAALAPQLSEGLLQEALEAARKIGYKRARARALAALATRLPEDQRAQALREALEAAWEIRDEPARAEALAALAPQLSEGLLQEALEAARKIGYKRARAEALAALAPQLSGGLLREALEAARKIQDESARAWALAALAPRLPEDQRAQALREALEAARKIQDEEERARVLAELAPQLAALSPSGLYPLWAETLPLLARRTRRDLLSDLRALAPVIHALGGEAALWETFRAIRDVGRWWP
ncbi:ATP-binding protein [Thermoflexus sp.]|uniref:ATP-binding protein n=1 Tax=Thermoflexus sp. TaxID=1969742 RepID=UPI002ADD5C8F|nr:ATP-binding protein [Thermoflexus sp.]